MLFSHNNRIRAQEKKPSKKKTAHAHRQPRRRGQRDGDHDLLGEDGGDSLAGAAPGSEAVEQDDLVFLDRLLPLLNTARYKKSLVSWMASQE